MSAITLNVSDFTKEAFNRYIDDGEGSGEEFRIKHIVPNLALHDLVIINLDGIDDEYGSSFLSEAFANLIRKENFSYETLNSKLQFKSNNTDWLKEVNRFILEAKKDVEGKAIVRNGSR